MSIKMDYFLEIFKHNFHKFKLVGVKCLGQEVSSKKRKYFRFIGKFEFEPPKQTFSLDWETGKAEILEAFRGIEEEESNCIKRKFTKKYYTADGRLEKKLTFQYIFDIVPRNIVDFDIDRDGEKMRLYVLGYGAF